MKTAKINVAPSSTSGHFITKTNKVINLDNVNETFFVEEPAELVTQNHTTLVQKEKGLPAKWFTILLPKCLKSHPTKQALIFICFLNINLYLWSVLIIKNTCAVKVWQQK